MKILVTGAAGFIGMHVAQSLLERGDEVVGIDNLNDYYPVSLKQARLAVLQKHPGFRFQVLAVEDREGMTAYFAREKPQRVVHLAAQAGVRYSLENPHVYIDSNIQGFMNILEACRRHGVGHLVYASSSSVYGGNTTLPFAEHQAVDHPVSLYAATKKANELMAHTYSHLYGLPTTGLRYFTVYGPWGRPDMSPWLFTSAILEGRPIKVFNHGSMQRDFTFVEDICEGTVRVLDRVPAPDPAFDPARPDPGTAAAPFRIYNIGNHSPVPLLSFIETLERALGREAVKEFLPMQPGDVEATFADVDRLRAEVGWQPRTPLAEGLGRWVKWYLDYREAP